MNTKQIYEAMGSNNVCRKHFNGVYPLDLLPEKIDKNKIFACIVNFDKSNQKGSHWISIFYSGNRNPVEYFDSYGQPPQHSEIKLFLKKFGSKYIHNKHQLQEYFSTVCGQYCCVYLSSRLLGVSLSKFIKQFSKNNFNLNDDVIARVFNKIFATRKRVRKRMVCVQSCCCKKKKK
jgi:hypothetical protein